MVGLKHSKFRAIDRLLVKFDFCETPDAVTSTVPEIQGGSFLMNKCSFDYRLEARLPVVQFQKENISRYQLTEFF